MPFNVGESINEIADSLLRAPIVISIAQNPIYTSFAITLIVVLIIMFIFRDVDADESLLVMCLRSGFWIFIMLVGTLFIHNKVLMNEHSNTLKTGQYEEVINANYIGEPGTRSSILEDNIVPVQINTNFI